MNFDSFRKRQSLWRGWRLCLPQWFILPHVSSWFVIINFIICAQTRPRAHCRPLIPDGWLQIKRSKILILFFRPIEYSQFIFDFCYAKNPLINLKISTTNREVWVFVSVRDSTEWIIWFYSTNCRYKLQFNRKMTNSRIENRRTWMWNEIGQKCNNESHKVKQNSQKPR